MGRHHQRQQIRHHSTSTGIRGCPLTSDPISRQTFASMVSSSGRNCRAVSSRFQGSNILPADPHLATSTSIQSIFLPNRMLGVYTRFIVEMLKLKSLVFLGTCNRFARCRKNGSSGRRRPSALKTCPMTSVWRELLAGLRRKGFKTLEAPDE